MLIVPSYTPVGAGTYTINYEAMMANTDQVITNNTLSQTIEVSTYSYARDNGITSGALGIGAGNGGYLGNQYTLPNNGKVGSVTVKFSKGYIGKPVGVAVFDMVGGKPNALIHTTSPAVYSSDTGGYYTLNFPSNITLNAADYVFAVIEFDSTVQVVNTVDNFTPGKMWVQWPTSPSSPTIGGWLNAETFGSGFAKPFAIRPNFCPSRTISFSTTNASCNLNNGKATVLPILDLADTVHYSWSNGGTGASINNLAPGTYKVTITDGAFCTYIDSVVINNTPLPNNAITQNGDTLKATQLGASYQWVYCDKGSTTIAGDTNQTFKIPGNGSYAVTITLNDCSVTSECVIVNNVNINSLGNNTTFNIYPNPIENKLNLEINNLENNTIATIFSIDGKAIVSKNIINNITEINVEQLPKGMYVLQLKNNSYVSSIKIIKE
jgi:hypothetical protein